MHREGTKPTYIVYVRLQISVIWPVTGSMPMLYVLQPLLRASPGYQAEVALVSVRLQGRRPHPVSGRLHLRLPGNVHS